MLNAEHVREMLDNEPFLPFWVRMKDGSRFPINDREEVGLPSGRLFLLSGMRQIPLDQVDALEVDERSRRRHMTLQAIESMYRAEPFVPFNIRLADGRSVNVKSREFFATAPRGRTVTVYQPDGSFNVIDLLLVSDLEVERQPLLEEDN